MWEKYEAEGKDRGENALCPPTFEQLPVNRIEIKDFPYGLINQIINALQSAIERGYC